MNGSVSGPTLSIFWEIRFLLEVRGTSRCNSNPFWFPGWNITHTASGIKPWQADWEGPIPKPRQKKVSPTKHKWIPAQTNRRGHLSPVSEWRWSNRLRKMYTVAPPTPSYSNIYHTSNISPVESIGVRWDKRPLLSRKMSQVMQHKQPGSNTRDSTGDCFAAGNRLGGTGWINSKVWPSGKVIVL